VGISAVVLVAAVTSRVDPSTPGAYPLCPFRALTGLQCPGCGSLRALHDLTRGDLVGALDHNALLVGVLVVAAISAVRTMVRPDGARVWARRRVAPVVIAGLVLWTVARNLPVAPFTVLAP
jgi:hypothetical protein